jgi:hypothetical protein
MSIGSVAKDNRGLKFKRHNEDLQVRKGLFKAVPVWSSEFVSKYLKLQIIELKLFKGFKEF